MTIVNNTPVVKALIITRDSGVVTEPCRCLIVTRSEFKLENSKPSVKMIRRIAAIKTNLIQNI
jgi:hypothetical protein